MIATTSGIRVGFLRFPPINGTGSRVADPVRSVNIVVALPTLPPPYPDLPPNALPLPVCNTTASDGEFNSRATVQLIDTCREQP